jgi:hypothetical protein
MFTSWFSSLFGFEEGSYNETRGRFLLEPGATQGSFRLVSKANSRRFDVGTFSCPTLASLRAEARTLLERLGPQGPTVLSHRAVGDIFTEHHRPENRGAVFQVASQFNALEFAHAYAVPEEGVADYANDPTQGPACSLACGAATVFRNYFATVDPSRPNEGQRRDSQLNNADLLSRALSNIDRANGGSGEPLFRVVNGYTQGSVEGLTRLSTILADVDRDELIGALKISVHSRVGVDFANRGWGVPPAPTHVTQAFCSAVSCAYTRIETSHWAPLATMVLDGAYEATLLTAFVEKARGIGSGRVFLTLLGGGVFGNEDTWITASIARAVGIAEEMGLDVVLVHYRKISDDIVLAVGPVAAPTVAVRDDIEPRVDRRTRRCHGWPCLP